MLKSARTFTRMGEGIPPVNLTGGLTPTPMAFGSFTPDFSNSPVAMTNGVGSNSGAAADGPQPTSRGSGGGGAIGVGAGSGVSRGSGSSSASYTSNLTYPVQSGNPPTARSSIGVGGGGAYSVNSAGSISSSDAMARVVSAEEIAYALGIGIGDDMMGDLGSLEGLGEMF